MDMMTRRRAMMAGIALPEWDLAWNYADGYPDNNGFTLTTSGTSSRTMQEDGLLIKANNSAYRFYTAPEDYAMSVGVIEVKLYIPTCSNADKSLGIFRIGNSSSAMTVYFFLTSGGTRGIKVYNAGTFKGGTTISSYSFDTWMTLRVEIDNGYADIYKDGSIISSHRDMSTIHYPGRPRFGVQNGAGNGSVWEYVKIKKDRL